VAYRLGDAGGGPESLLTLAHLEGEVTRLFGGR
jgi:hypothetical protein